MLWCHRQSNDSPKLVHILILQIYDYVTLYIKEDFANVIQSRILRWEDYLGLPKWAQCSHKDP